MPFLIWHPLNVYLRNYLTPRIKSKPSVNNIQCKTNEHIDLSYKVVILIIWAKFSAGLKQTSNFPFLFCKSTYVKSFPSPTDSARRPKCNYFSGIPMQQRYICFHSKDENMCMFSAALILETIESPALSLQ